MPYHFASRMEKTPRSFIREILKTTEKPEVISFAGGLPSPSLFAVEELAAAARDVMADSGRAALQYSTTEGYLPLREFIADRYRRRLGLSVDPDEILITNGSQQCLDLIGKVFLDPGDPVIIERPGYLGAIQAFSLYEPAFRSVPLLDDGPDIGALEAMLEEEPARLFYGVPNAQNPSGITYSEEKRRAVAAALAGTGTVFVEDDAYGHSGSTGGASPPSGSISVTRQSSPARSPRLSRPACGSAGSLPPARSWTRSPWRSRPPTCTRTRLPSGSSPAISRRTISTLTSSGSPGHIARSAT